MSNLALEGIVSGRFAVLLSDGSAPSPQEAVLARQRRVKTLIPPASGDSSRDQKVVGESHNRDHFQPVQVFRISPESIPTHPASQQIITQRRIHRHDAPGGEADAMSRCLLMAARGNPRSTSGRSTAGRSLQKKPRRMARIQLPCRGQCLEDWEE